MYIDAFIYLIIHYWSPFIHFLFFYFYHKPLEPRGLSAMVLNMDLLKWLNWQGLIYQQGVKSRMRERSYTAEASSPLFHVQSRLQAALNQTISSRRHQKSLICVYIIYFHS